MTVLFFIEVLEREGINNSCHLVTIIIASLILVLNVTRLAFYMYNFFIADYIKPLIRGFH